MHKFLLFNSFTSLIAVVMSYSIVCVWLEQEKGRARVNKSQGD